MKITKQLNHHNTAPAIQLQPPALTKPTTAQTTATATATAATTTKQRFHLIAPQTKPHRHQHQIIYLIIQTCHLALTILITMEQDIQVHKRVTTRDIHNHHKFIKLTAPTQCRTLTTSLANNKWLLILITTIIATTAA